MPRSFRMSAITWPSRASEGAVRKNKPLSSMVDRPGDVADGEIMTMPFGIATFCRIAPVTPEQSPPMMPATPSAIMRSPFEVARPLSIQPVSARDAETLTPSSSLPDSVTSAIAISAPDPIAGASDSIGPVKPNKTPSVTSSAIAVPASRAVAAVAVSSFFIRLLPYWNDFVLGTTLASCPKKKSPNEIVFLLLTILFVLLGLSL